ncbi:hypothetical protein ADL34_21595 [Streptomyces sp. NRRL WC-3605]|nr:hypothetical protein ADL34_21595 [Streptomyces sp. NRRL WC-3605]KUL74220.1 hypothetical protein ADL33_18200 [Streptomyces sp. NRRL WC-3604]
MKFCSAGLLDGVCFMEGAAEAGDCRNGCHLFLAAHLLEAWAKQFAQSLLADWPGGGLSRGSDEWRSRALRTWFCPLLEAPDDGSEVHLLHAIRLAQPVLRVIGVHPVVSVRAVSRLIHAIPRDTFGPRRIVGISGNLPGPCYLSCFFFGGFRLLGFLGFFLTLLMLFLILSLFVFLTLVVIGASWLFGRPPTTWYLTGGP